MRAHRWTLAAAAVCTALGASLGAARADMLFENVTLIDGTGNQPLPGASVLVKGDRIDIVSAGPIKHPAGVQVVDGKGKFLMPGLIDSHIHLGANTITPENANAPWVSACVVRSGAGGGMFGMPGIRIVAALGKGLRVTVAPATLACWALVTRPLTLPVWAEASVDMNSSIAPSAV